MKQEENFKFTDADIIQIENVLYKAISLFYETPYPSQIKGNIQDYFIKFCYERKYPLKDTLDVLNGLLKPHLQVSMKDIVPESKSGKKHLVNGTLCSMLLKVNGVWNEEKRGELIGNFCDLTGISEEFANPLIDIFVKKKKREVIEKEIYDDIQRFTKKLDKEADKSQIADEIISMYAEYLKMDPGYIYDVIKNKKQKDINEEKRVAEYKAQMGIDVKTDYEDDTEAR